MADDSPITAALFWSKVYVPHDRAGCWTWTRTVGANGYGRFWSNGAWHTAHRVAHELVNGSIPEGLQVRHMCHNRLCCNPKHLQTGTAQENAQDAISAGRFSSGTVNGKAKINEEIAAYIRQNPDRLNGRALAAKFGVSPATVSGIRNGRVWNTLPHPIQETTR